MHDTSAIYKRLPVWAQNVAVTLYGGYWRSRRLGGRFAEYVEQFRSRDRMGPNGFQGHVNERLGQVLRLAMNKVPYYSEAWANAGVGLVDVTGTNSPDILSMLPVTRKDDLRRDPLRFVVSDLAGRWDLVHHESSGSTGTPVTAIWRADDHRRFVAVREVRSFNWAGTSILKSRSMIGGRMVVPKTVSQPPFHRYNAVEKQVYLSAFHISPGTVSDYVSAFKKHKPAVLTGYSNSHYLLARMMLEQGLSLDYQPEAVILSSEKVTDHMRTAIENAFGAPVFEEYGCVENCVLATECEEGRLHVSPDFGVVEIVDDDDVPVPPGRIGRIICTGLLNDVQPLIRYEVGDLGRWAIDTCPCGRDHLPVIDEIVGRLEDAVVGPDGREMVRFHGVFINLDGIHEGQIVQHEVSRIEVRVVPENGLRREIRDEIERRVRERLGDVEVFVTAVDEIKRTERGKFRSVVSHVNRQGIHV